MPSPNNASIQSWRLGVSIGLVALATLGLAILSHGGPVPPRKSLDDFPQTLGPWVGKDMPIDAKTQEVLGATDLLSRTYVNVGSNAGVGFFIGFFSSQKKGGAVHSPKNCLPGAGWEISKGSMSSLDIPGSAPLAVNEYIIEKDMSRQVVLYWYQSQGRVIASEYWAKVYLVVDAIKHNRTDGALVRVIAPIQNGGEAAAVDQAKTFAQAIFPHLSEYIPN